MKNTSTCLILILLLSVEASSQQSSRIIEDPAESKTASQLFVFNGISTAKLDKDINEVDLSMIKKHSLGEIVAKRLHLLEESYTYYTEIPGAFSDKRVIQKPIIYNSIYKIDKYYRKKVRKELQGKQKAAAELCHHIDIALTLLYKDTKKFERELENADKVENMIDVFNRVKIR